MLYNTTQKVFLNEANWLRSEEEQARRQRRRTGMVPLVVPHARSAQPWLFCGAAVIEGHKTGTAGSVKAAPRVARAVRLPAEIELCSTIAR